MKASVEPMNGTPRIGRPREDNTELKPYRLYRWFSVTSLLRLPAIGHLKAFIQRHIPSWVSHKEINVSIQTWKTTGDMRIHRVHTYDEFLAHSARNKQSIEQHQALLQKITPKEQISFTVPGYSYTAGKQVDFIVDFQHSGDSGQVNWRERVCCPETYFNNRMRATFHLFDLEMQPYPDSKIYITEQITPIFTYFAGQFPGVVGSEFLGDHVPFGHVNENGVRNETLCALSFPDQSFDTLVSLDVLEHIPDYERAFRECARILKKGGKMMWSVPFIATSSNNVVRARIENGEIIHILPPEYHGNPLSNDGILCFTHFGWQMLDQMRAAGFRDAYALCYHSSKFGYLGSEQFMFIAIK
jgi:hypothetical protein